MEKVFLIKKFILIFNIKKLGRIYELKVYNKY